jgi:hypothetical protein
MCVQVLSNKNRLNYLVNLAQLIGYCIIYVVERRFQPQSSYLSTFRVKFIATRLLDQKQKC